MSSFQKKRGGRGGRVRERGRRGRGGHRGSTDRRGSGGSSVCLLRMPKDVSERAKVDLFLRCSRHLEDSKIVLITYYITVLKIVFHFLFIILIKDLLIQQKNNQ